MFECSWAGVGVSECSWAGVFECSCAGGYLRGLAGREQWYRSECVLRRWHVPRRHGAP